MPKSFPRRLTVVSTENVTPNMQRLVLGGSDLGGFPEGQESGYIKLLFPLPGESKLPTVESIELGALVQMRTYTIRKYDPNALELTVDFVLHGEGEHAGPASHWAKTATPNDEVIIIGPGPSKLVDMSADWFLLAGDMTALPAISCNLEAMPRTGTGYAVIEIHSPADKQPLVKPEGVEIIWVINPHPDRENTRLTDAVKALPWLEGRPSVWAACEFSNMRLLRAYFKQDRAVPREALYVSSYWKIGSTEDQHKIAKQLDARAERQ